ACRFAVEEDKGDSSDTEDGARGENAEIAHGFPEALKAQTPPEFGGGAARDMRPASPSDGPSIGTATASKKLILPGRAATSSADRARWAPWPLQKNICLPPAAG